MKVLFLIPPSLDGKPVAERIFGCNYGVYPQDNIFILYPATILKNKGHDVMCLDFPVLHKKKQDFIKFCRFNSFDIVVIYTVFLSKKTDLMARDFIRAANNKTRFIYIGTEPTAYPEDFIEDDTIVIRGESELSIVEVVDAIAGTYLPLEGVSGVSFCKQGKVIHNKGCGIIDNLDVLPFPDRSLFGNRRYYNPKLGSYPFTTMVTSRGCSFRCYYCVPHSLDFAREIEYKLNNDMAKPPVRLRSPANIIEEFRMLVELGYRAVSFIDDQFVWGGERTKAICDGIKDLGIEWSCLARADTLVDYDVVKAMADAGCKLVAMGIESFDQRILDYINKGCKKDIFYMAIENLKKASIGIEFNILIGSCPLETRQTIYDTYREVVRLKPDYVLFSICTPFPHTDFYLKAKQNGWMSKPEYEAVDPTKKALVSYPHLMDKELERIIRILYLRYYFRLSFLLGKVLKLRGLRDMVNKVRAAATIFK